MREERARDTGNHPEVLRDPGKSGVAVTIRAGPVRIRHIQDWHVLQILPEYDTVNSDVTHDIVTSDGSNEGQGGPQGRA